MEVNYAGGEVKANYAFNGGTGDLSSLGINNSGSFDYSWYKEYWQPVIKEYYPVYTYSYIDKEDKFKRAFSIAKLMLKKKLLISRKLPDFISLVEMIAEEL